MSDRIEGECWVCGKLTRNRCTACTSAEPGIDIFFCSRACQKFVYPVHRFVCGERANPFTFPSLPPDEAEEAIAHLYTPYTHSNVPKSLAQHLGECGMPEALINTALIFSLSTEPVDDPQSQVELSLIRHSEFLRLANSSQAHTVCAKMWALRDVSRTWVRDLYDLPGSASRTLPGLCRFLHHHLHYQLLLFRRRKLNAEERALAIAALQHNYNKAVECLESIRQLDVGNGVKCVLASLNTMHEQYGSVGQQKGVTRL